MRRAIIFLSFTLAILIGLAGLWWMPSLQSDEVVHAEYPREVLTNLDTYENTDYGFSVAVPAGWSPVIADVDDDDRLLEPGYAIGFESGRQGKDDRFADYILVELLPGRDSGLFETDGRQREMIKVNGKSGFREQLRIDGRENGLSAIDLIVHQAEIQGLGYTIAFYAIGEPTNEVMMRDAFDVMLRTFRLKSSPFFIS